MTKVDINSEILPGVGLGGINIGQSISDVDVREFDIKNINETKCAYCNNGSIFVVFDENNKVRQASALLGYKGRLFERYFIGESVSALSIDGWTFREDLDGFIRVDAPGVIIRTDLEDPNLDEVEQRKMELVISEITVAKTI